MNWNNLKTPFKALVVIAIVLISWFAINPITKTIHLGLDLQGGARLLVQLLPTAEVPKVGSTEQEQTVEVIDRRINGIGVTEPTISKVGTDRILLDLPAVKDPDQAEKLIKQVAVLDFKILPEEVVQNGEAALRVVAVGSTATAAQKAAAEKYLNVTAYAQGGPVVYSGKDLKAAQASFAQAGQPDVLFQTKDAARFYKLTSANLGKPLGMFLDHRYVSAPTLQGAIADNGQITGQFTQEQTITLANELNAGALPVGVKVIEKESIGPTLGAIDLKQSLYASIGGLIVVMIFMILVYRLPGLLADLALVVYVLMMLALLAASKATLTLPGIAGFVLSIGMAVDANVLIFERLKEELWHGKNLRAAVRVGFTRAFSAVFDSHFTTIVGAGVLFLLGTGTVKGFAFTLFWGTVFSLVTAVFITRFFVDVLVDNDVATAPELYGVKKDEVGIFSKAGA
ncbi:MAG: protein translocase subunit SecD [Candidatus Eremiobacteraeota bacterium]|nr:protein translocase subunit SecD [Candidatus Eremiobacteraeota bacterium]